ADLTAGGHQLRDRDVALVIAGDVAVLADRAGPNVGAAAVQVAAPWKQADDLEVTPAVSLTVATGGRHGGSGRHGRERDREREADDRIRACRGLGEHWTPPRVWRGHLPHPVDPFCLLRSCHGDYP